MPQSKILRNLLLKKDIELAEEELKECGHALEKSKDKCPQKVSEYNEKRINFLKLQLALQQESWCTFCDRIFPSTEISLVFLEGAQYDLIQRRKRVREIHQVCFKCKEHALAKNDQSKNGRSPDDSREVCAFPVEIREGGYYVVTPGTLTQISRRYHKTNISGNLVERIALERGLPPRMILLRPEPVRPPLPRLTKKQQVRDKRTLLIIYMRVKDSSIL